MHINTPSKVVAGLLGLLFSAWLGAQQADSFTIGDPYVRAVPPGQPNSAAFFTITNNTSQEHALVAAESDVATTVELHTHTMENGMMQMRRIDRIDLPAGATTTLKPGGLHVMFIGLEQKLLPNERVSLTLVFDDGSRKQIEAEVRKLKMHMKKMHRGGMSH